jgi:hypothetical protein
MSFNKGRSVAMQQLMMATEGSATDQKAAWCMEYEKIGEVYLQEDIDANDGYCRDAAELCQISTELVMSEYLQEPDTEDSDETDLGSYCHLYPAEKRDG